MTTPDRSPIGDAPEADVVEQRIPVDDSDEDSWRDTQRVGDDRDWQASEADLIEQATAVPDDEPEFDR
ncbi:hypothetical protein C6A85_000000107670 [Mycobacterium sp. ITM-2017-0098]|nr:hypothetical protein C6A85_000000107670 [Mycobacterium sp. ITM-2017-0098]